jgi:protein-disulfide isomerase
MSKAARQRSARERLAEERRIEAARKQRNRAIMIIVSALAVVVVAVGVGVYFANKKQTAAKRTQIASAYTGTLAPVSRQSDGSILMSQPNVTAPKLEIFEDFQCPICKEFETASASTIKKLAAEGKVRVTYYPFWLFEQQPQPTSGNSLRAANAALCAPTDKWVSFHDTIYKFQGNEQSPGFSNTLLIGWARDLGFDTPAFETCVKNQSMKSKVQSMTDYSEKSRSVQGTPTVYLNGKSLDLSSQLLNPSALESTILGQPVASTPASPAPTGPATASPKTSPSP